MTRSKTGKLKAGKAKAGGTKAANAGSEGVFGVGSAAFRKVMERSFGRGQVDAELDNGEASGGLSEMLARDPINSAIESEIIPRLMMAHTMPGISGEDIASFGPEGGAISPTDLSLQRSEFGSLPLQLDAADLLDHMEGYLQDGVGFDTICVEVLAPAARALGTMWVEDECDFVDVTMGLWRLQEVMRSLSAKVPTATPRNAIRSTALFAPIPGDPHVFGAQMLDEIFAKAGWISEVAVKPLRRELLDRISRKPFDLIGLSITRGCPLSAIASIVKTMRNVSANPHISILIGGNMVNANPAIVDEVGADGTAFDAHETLKLAESLVEASHHKALTLR